MWIIPKKLSVFVQDTGAWKWELSELAEILEQSVIMNLKPSLKQTWLRRLKREKWIQDLYGLTLKPSLHQSFVERWMASPVGTLANHFQMQGNDKEKKTQDICGPTYGNTLTQSNQDGFLPKMSTGTCRLDSPQLLPTWQKMVTEWKQEYLVRVKLGHHIKEKESLSWPPPQASEGKANRHRNNPNAKGSQVWLTTEVLTNWATPNTMDCLPSRSYEAMKRQATTGGRKNRKRPGNLREQIDPLMCQAYVEAREEANGLPVQEKSNTSGKSQEQLILNCNWVEQLMGLPSGWTQLPTEHQG